MKVTVYVRGVDERLFDAVAAGTDLAVSGWAYRALLEAAVREAKRLAIPVPPTVVEQLERLRLEESKSDDRGPKPHGKTKPRSKRET